MSFRQKWKKLTGGSLGIIIYAFLGVFFAFVLNQALALALQTDLPVVAVMSTSMQHDNADVTYYRWLKDNLGYSDEYIRSWPITGGFAMGDMPIVVGTDSYNIGDIIVYTVPDQNVPIIHRIIKINSDGTYQTKGDNNLSQLPYEYKISKDQIHGKVVFVIPKLGYFKVIFTKLFGV